MNGIGVICTLSMIMCFFYCSALLVAGSDQVTGKIETGRLLDWSSYYSTTIKPSNAMAQSTRSRNDLDRWQQWITKFPWTWP